MMDELELAEAVAEGAAFMDAIDKDLPEAERWYWIVEPAQLDMSMSTRGHRQKCGCVLGQHSPAGFYYPADYGLEEGEDVALGFDRSVVGPIVSYEVLTALWVEQIDDRRAAYFDRHPEAVLS